MQTSTLGLSYKPVDPFSTDVTKKIIKYDRPRTGHRPKVRFLLFCVTMVGVPRCVPPQCIWFGLGRTLIGGLSVRTS